MMFFPESSSLSKMCVSATLLALTQGEKLPGIKVKRLIKATIANSSGNSPARRRLTLISGQKVVNEINQPQGVFSNGKNIPMFQDFKQMFENCHEAAIWAGIAASKNSCSHINKMITPESPDENYAARVKMFLNGEFQDVHVPNFNRIPFRKCHRALWPLYIQQSFLNYYANEVPNGGNPMQAFFELTSYPTKEIDVSPTKPIKFTWVQQQLDKGHILTAYHAEVDHYYSIVGIEARNIVLFDPNNVKLEERPRSMRFGKAHKNNTILLNGTEFSKIFDKITLSSYDHNWQRNAVFIQQPEWVQPSPESLKLGHGKNINLRVTLNGEWYPCRVVGLPIKGSVEIEVLETKNRVAVPLRNLIKTKRISVVNTSDKPVDIWYVITGTARTRQQRDVRVTIRYEEEMRNGDKCSKYTTQKLWLNQPHSVRLEPHTQYEFDSCVSLTDQFEPHRLHFITKNPENFEIAYGNDVVDSEWIESPFKDAPTDKQWPEIALPPANADKRRQPSPSSRGKKKPEAARSGVDHHSTPEQKMQDRLDAVSDLSRVEEKTICRTSMQGIKSFETFKKNKGYVQHAEELKKYFGQSFKQFEDIMKKLVKGFYQNFGRKHQRERVVFKFEPDVVCPETGRKKFRWSLRVTGVEKAATSFAMFKQ